MAGCTPEDAALGLLEAVHADVRWRTDLTYAGQQTVFKQRRCAAAAFEAYVCSLPAHPGQPLAQRVFQPDHAFGAEPPSLGKCLARWTMHLYLGLADTPARRYALDDDELDDWRWLPEGGCGADRRKRRSWVTYDVCMARTRLPPADLGRAMLASPGGIALLSHLRGNATGRLRGEVDRYRLASYAGGETAAGAWVAGQLFRMVRASLGLCGRAAVAELGVQSLGAPVTDDERNGVAQRHDAQEGRGRRPGSSRTKALDAVAPLLQRAAARAPFAVAVHVRRGDACERWVDPAPVQRRRRTRKGRLGAEAGRPCFLAQDYMRAASWVLTTLRGIYLYLDLPWNHGVWLTLILYLSRNISISIYLYLNISIFLSLSMYIYMHIWQSIFISLHVSYIYL